MTYDYSKLIGAIAEKFSSRCAFARAIGLSEHSLSVKLNGKVAWKQSEIAAACAVLAIPVDLIGTYFFTAKVQCA